ncbi:unnamed protein product, partial [Lampetra fluviatilis]
MDEEVEVDVVEVEEEVLEQHGDYLYVRLLRLPLPASCRREGFVPTRCLVPSDSLQSHQWYFGAISRQEAERLLLLPDNVTGSFLVTHYKINRDGKGRFSLCADEHFAGVKALVEACCRSRHGLCAKLTQPCKEPSPCPTAPSALSQLVPYESLEATELSRQSVSLVREIGRGEFGVVHEGRLHGRTPIAVKQLHPTELNLDEFLREAGLLKRLVHDNVVRLYGVCTTGGPPLIVTELMASNLKQHLKVSELSLADMVLGCRQVAAGLGFLASQGVVHRDVAARNVLVATGDSGVWKVADLGIARVVADDLYVARPGVVVPIKWTAPEALERCIFSSASDAWSFGILMVEVMSGGEDPYP